jgi:hypothetical protein
MHAYHVRLSRITKHHLLISEVMERLRQNIARRIGMPQADLETRRVMWVMCFLRDSHTQISVIGTNASQRHVVEPRG